MAFTTSESMSEGTLATAFPKAVVVALADLMDYGTGQSRRAQQQQQQHLQQHQKETTTTSSTMALESSSQKAVTQIRSIQTKSSSSCAPYDTMYWLGGDCLRATTATTMTTIMECATMKTDNTTATEMPAIVSPSNSSTSSSIISSNSSRGKEGHLAVLEDQIVDTTHKEDTNDSIGSHEMNTNANADIISRYHQQFLTEEVGTDRIDRRHSNNSNSIFTDSNSAEIHSVDYNDPMNSILVEDHDPPQTDFSRNYYSRNSNIRGIKNNDRHFRNKYNRKNGNQSSSLFCNKNTFSISETEEEDWYSATSSSPASCCGGYPSLLVYDNDDYNDTGNYNGDGDDDNDNCDTTTQERQKQQLQHQHEQQSEEKQHPHYYADFKPLRQFAFDEEDSEYSRTSGSALTPTKNRAGALVDGTDDNDAATTNTNDGGGSVLTNGSSIQSFMVINRPHININSSIPSNTSRSTRLTEKLERKNSKSSSSSRQRGYSHLHNVISSSGTSRTGNSVATNSDSDSVTHNNSLDYALSQSLMRKLQKHFPYGKRGDSFWLQYSLLRDGASLDSLLEMVQRDTNSNINNNNICSVLAIETVEGEVFGAFLTQTWRRSYRQWYGGGQSFLWTTENSGSSSSRKGKSFKDKNLKVFPYSFENSYVQLCDRDRMLVGGGGGDCGDNYERHSYGFGLALENDLLRGSSSPCTTFQSPSLSKIHSDGSSFEIRNLEVWTLTPCLSMVDNPSQGRVRVHKRDARTNTRKATKKKNTAKVAEHSNTTSDETTAAEIGNSFHDFYNCSHPNCQGIETMENNSEEFEASRSFPEVPRPKPKHRSRYICPSGSF